MKLIIKGKIGPKIEKLQTSPHPKLDKFINNQIVGALLGAPVSFSC